MKKEEQEEVARVAAFFDPYPPDGRIEHNIWVTNHCILVQTGRLSSLSKGILSLADVYIVTYVLDKNSLVA